jgi:hypothetical protein
VNDELEKMRKEAAILSTIAEFPWRDYENLCKTLRIPSFQAEILT